MPLLSRYILLLCFLIHIQISASPWIYNTGKEQTPLLTNFYQGVLYLLYPLSGWIADVFKCRFGFIKCSFICRFVSSGLSLVIGICLLLHIKTTTRVYDGLNSVCFSIEVLGLGMYEANAIQFGMDQMLEASSEQLSSFIRWYFWCGHVGQLVYYYIIIAVLYHYFLDCVDRTPLVHLHGMYRLGWIIVFFSSVTAIVFAVQVSLSFFCSKCFRIEQTSQNPLKKVYEILKYSYHHKYPERRSAFTFWENDMPSRIDIGKQKYGGPFTYEQVEDVKTMFRLLLLMVSLFGFHISGDGYSLSNYTMNTLGCPSKWPFLLIIMNPQHITLIIVLLGVPLQQFLRRHFSYYHQTSLLRTVKAGLCFCLLGELFFCFYSAIIPDNKILACPFLEDIADHPPDLFVRCAYTNAKTVSNVDGSCFNSCSSYLTHSYVIYFSLIPLAFKGLSYLLIFVTMLEFICAQSPNSMKGILIGVWYSTLAIKFSLVNCLDVHFQHIEMVPWNIYHGIKGVIVFLSIIVFWWVCKHYHYRERNEVVNEQAIVEEVYERELFFNSVEDSNDSY